MRTSTPLGRTTCTAPLTLALDAPLEGKVVKASLASTSAAAATTPQLTTSRRRTWAILQKARKTTPHHLLRFFVCRGSQARLVGTVLERTNTSTTDYEITLDGLRQEATAAF